MGIDIKAKVSNIKCEEAGPMASLVEQPRRLHIVAPAHAASRSPSTRSRRGRGPGAVRRAREAADWGAALDARRRQHLLRVDLMTLRPGASAMRVSLALFGWRHGRR
jgi:hypothetical protein